MDFVRFYLNAICHVCKYCENSMSPYIFNFWYYLHRDNHIKQIDWCTIVYMASTFRLMMTQQYLFIVKSAHDYPKQGILQVSIKFWYIKYITSIATVIIEPYFKQLLNVCVRNVV